MPRRLWVTWLILPITAALYLGYVVWLGVDTGFPLDDSWIHQTYARNLVLHGEFAYNAGEPSAASTSPLWTLMLAIGYLIPSGFHLWTYALGLLFLGLTSWVGYLLSRKLFPRWPRLAILTAIAILLEWRLDWAALSGMETMLFAFCCLSLIYLAVRGLEEELSPFLIGLVGALAGLTAVVRPEGVVLAALALAALAWRQKRKSVVAWAVGIALVFLLPLAAFNLVVSGNPLPSTFYAKHAAYSQPFTLGFVASYLGGALATLAGGPLAILLPGVAYVVYCILRVRAASANVVAGFMPAGNQTNEGAGVKPATTAQAGKQKGGAAGVKPATTAFPEGDRSRRIAPFILIGLWIAGLLGLYMVRLPALFHHGRYLMPLLPVLVVVGLGGLAGLAEVVPLRLLSRVYGALVVIVFMVLWVNGAVVFGWDVKFIDEEQIETAMWLDRNIPADAVVATHDIGAIGYFSGRRIIDTAGLITPELAPHVRDETRILDYLQRKKVDYLAVFPKWYPHIVADSRFNEVFAVSQPYAVAAGADNMRVYRATW